MRGWRTSIFVCSIFFALCENAEEESVSSCCHKRKQLCSEIADGSICLERECLQRSEDHGSCEDLVLAADGLFSHLMKESLLHPGLTEGKFFYLFRNPNENINICLILFRNSLPLIIFHRESLSFLLLLSVFF